MAAWWKKDYMQDISLDVSQSPYIKYLQLSSSFTLIKYIQTQPRTLQFFFLKIKRGTKYFNNMVWKRHIYEGVKVIVKFNVSFLLMDLKYTLPLVWYSFISNWLHNIRGVFWTMSNILLGYLWINIWTFWIYEHIAVNK